MPVELYKDSPETLELIKHLRDQGNRNIHLAGLCGSARSAFVHACLSRMKGHHLIILGEKEDAGFFHNDLVTLGGIKPVFFLPSSYTRSIQYKKTDEANIINRTQVFQYLSERHTSAVIVTYPEALMERVLSRKNLSENTFEVKTGEKIGREFLLEFLDECRFELVDFVFEPGQYSVRGSLVDVFSWSASQPYRIDFFGDEVESIRTFDTENQLSLEMVKKFSLVPNVQWEQNPELKRVSFFDYLPADTLIWAGDVNGILHRVGEVWEKTSLNDSENIHLSKDEVILGRDEMELRLLERSLVVFDGKPHTTPSLSLNFYTSPQPVFNKNFELLIADIRQRKEENYRVFILSENEKQVERLREIFSEIDPNAGFEPLLKVLHEGFIDHTQKLCFYTDHQIFDRYHKFRLADRFTKKEAISIRELTDLSPGDYVVHVDHGIGVFGGLETIEVSGRKQESIRLIYKDKDVLYVSIHALHRISKFKGKDGEPPKVYKLGTGAWQKLKIATKKRVKDIAAGLIRLYAERRMKEGFRFSQDTYLQHELEASFIYEDTPDQVKATRDVKEGMEAQFPMDRLICGDVGFGKTEVAIRAAFKAVADSKQVAVLVPTTILALQHYNTFRERLKGFPCNVDYISRLRSAKQQKETLAKLAKGEVDIIIGTHKLIGKEVKFKDLGLLIIDEEQKFGVAAKEQLRQLRMDVDTLTLTATPIPRTLQFSLMGARDLSIINTPPPNRHPIITELHGFNEDIIREAVEYEVNRGGQVFFIHNRVQNIAEVEALVKRLCPGVRTVVAHGQMDGKQLENIMLDFMQGFYDVLVATTIIESGLDIPNANTIIINNAHHFGLSDLHQLRGRVGRSNKKAFCYLLAPPLHLNTPDAKRRLRAIEQFSELGSGLNIAMQDLDIRGAGNLLGGEQSGFIADIGFETYQRILNEAILELKENEFRDIFAGEEKSKEDNVFVSDCQVDTDLEVLFPGSYISNMSERIRLYRELDNLPGEEELLSFQEKLLDRFGPVPAPTQELMNVVRLRWSALKLGMEKVLIKSKKMVCYFVSNPDSPYFQSPAFGKVLNYTQRNSGKVQMKEDGNRLSLTINGVETVSRARDILRDMWDLY